MVKSMHFIFHGWTVSGPTPETSPENIGLLSILSSIIDLQLFDVYTVWQGMFLGLKLLVLYEKGIACLSPGAVSIFSQFIDVESSRGGVPVFNLPVLKP